MDCDVALLDAARQPDGTNADACVTTTPGRRLHDHGRRLPAGAAGNARWPAVAAAHAGWRGLAGSGGRGVLEAVWERLREHAGSASHETMAWLGPCIGPDRLRGGARGQGRVRGDRSAAPRPVSARTARANGWPICRVWLAGGCRRWASPGFMAMTAVRGWCTVANPSSFFSHRRDRVSGRFAACIWRL